MGKRMLSLVLALAMVMTMIPASALAALQSAVGTAGGSGSAGGVFTDVRPGSWYYDAVEYVRNNGLFSGVSEDRFDPEGSMTRGMFVTVLGRMAGVDPADWAGETGFSDVEAGSWCAPYVRWAAENGVAQGTGTGKFSPNAPIDRQQLAAFLVRYFDAFGVKLRGETGDTLPADLDKAAPWAREPLTRLWQAGLLQGDGTNIDPAARATRSQAAALCQRTDSAVETWYSAPGVPSARAPGQTGENAGENGSSSGNSGDHNGNSGNSGGNSGGNGGSSGGGTTTTYYQVSFAVGSQESGGEVTLPENRTVPSGTAIAGLGTPYQQDGLFLGWYYDSALSRPVGEGDTVTRNLTLYAKLGGVTPLSASETPNYITVTVPADQAAGYTFAIAGYVPEETTFVNVTANNAPVDYTVAAGGKVTVSGGLAQGQTYRVTLDDSSAARLVVGDVEQPESIRVLNLLTEKGEVENLRLDDGVKYIPKKDVSGMSDSLQGLFTASLVQDGEGETQAVQKVSGTGTFTYTAGSLSVGDTVAIYEGQRPDLRTQAAVGTSGDGAVVYVTITAAQGGKYTYRTADSEDVLFTPDILPLAVSAGWSLSGGTVTVDRDALDFSGDEYADLGLDSLTTVDAGDFLAFYTGELGGESSARGYGEILSVTEAGDEITLTYRVTDQAAVLAAMDLYSTREEKIELSETQAQAIARDMENQAVESGFVEEASQYLAQLALETDGFRELSDGEPWGLSACAVTDGAENIALFAGRRAEIVDKKVDAKVAAGKVLQHFDGSYGIRAELAMTFTVRAGSKVEITVQAIFEQEVLLSVNTSGGAIWKWKWIFPYIYDYQLNANIDLGTYTGIGITATARTVGDEDDDAFDWKPVTGTGAENRILDIGKQITELMEAKEQFLGEDVEWAGTSGGGLAEKYSAMMENAEESWVELFRKEIFSQEGSVDPFHILCYGVSADFVVKANLYVTLGLTFEYANAKRYNFSIKLFHKQSSNETIDLEEAHYQFDFYVMGTVGVRAGVELEVGVGLFSLKLDSIGICAEAGAYAQLWGYFYYHLAWSQSGGKESASAGAMLVEVGIYLTISFKAQLFSSDKLTYQPTLYDARWPLWSIGTADNVYDFAYGDDDERLNQTVQMTTEFRVPDGLFQMNYMDLRTGDLYGADADDPEENPAADYGSRVGDSYIITVSNPKFRFDPQERRVTVTPDGSVKEACDITFTWKNGALAFTSQPISRTLHIDWTDPANAFYIYVDAGTDEGTQTIIAAKDQMISAPADPVRQGYVFAGWMVSLYGRWHDYTFPETMPAYEYKGVRVRAKWRPAEDTPYTERYYYEELDGSFTEQGTEARVGTTEGLTDKTPGRAIPRGFELRKVTRETIAPDGSTVVDFYFYRRKWTVRFAFGPEGGEDSEPLYYFVKYGATVYLPTLALGGYDFQGFQGVPSWRISVTAGAQNGTDGRDEYTALWTPRTDTPYRVEHYIRRPGVRDKYVLSGDNVIESFTGTTASAIVAASKARTLEGLTYSHATVDGERTESAVITPDGKLVIKLYYDRQAFTLTLDRNDGSQPSSETRDYGQPISLTPLVRVGYVFGGWYTDAACTEENAVTDGALWMPARNVTLYAKWTPAGQSVTLRHFVMDPAGKYVQVGADEAIPAKTGDKITLSDHVREDLLIPGGVAYLEGKIAGKAGTEYVVPAQSPAVLELYYARRQYALTWNFNGGTASGSYTQGKVYYGAAITAPVPAKTGYAYHWSADVPETMPAGDVTLEALWSTRGDTAYTVEHYLQNADDEGYTLAQDGIEHLTGATDAEVTASYRTFDHFAPSESASGTKKTGTIAADGSLALRLYYDRENVTVTLDPNGGSLPNAGLTRTVRYGARLRVDEPTLTDYAFAGWYPEGSDTPFTGPVTEPMTLTARWAAKPVSFTVEHYVMGTGGKYPAARTSCETVRRAADSTVSLAGLAQSGLLVENGIVFDGEKTGESALVKKNMTVKLYYKRLTHTVTFVSEAGEELRRETLCYGAAITPPALSKPGYILTWTPALADTAPAEDVAYRAGWTASTSTAYRVEYYKENLNDDGYTLDPYDSATKYGRTGDTVTLPPRSDTGFTLDERASTLSGVIAGDGSLVLKAYYTRDRHTVTLDLDGGTLDGETGKVRLTCKHGKTLSLPRPAKEGYAFLRWEDSAGSEPAANITVTADRSLKAIWSGEDVEYTVIHHRMNLQGKYEDDPASPLNTVETHTAKAGTQGNASPECHYNYKYFWRDGFWETELNGKRTRHDWDTSSRNYFTVESGIIVHRYYVREKYTVSFYDEMGNELTELRWKSYVESPFQLPEIEQVENYVRRWECYNQPEREVPTTIPAEGLALKIRRTPVPFTVHFDTGCAAQLEDVKLGYTEELYQVLNPAKTQLQDANPGYAFDHWELDGKKANGADTMPAHDITIKAVWTVRECCITYDPVHGLEQRVWKKFFQTFADETGALQDPGTKVGYAFQGWYFTYTDAEGKEIEVKLDANTQLLPEYFQDPAHSNGIRVTARWSDVLVDYIVEYFYMDTAGNYPSAPSRVLTETRQIREGAYIPAPGDDERSFTLEDGITVTYAGRMVNDQPYTGSEKVTQGTRVQYLFARPQSSVWYYEGTGYNRETLYHGAVIPLYTPTWEHHRFLGWYTDRGCTQPIQSGTILTGKIDLYAKWELILVTVTMEDNTGDLFWKKERQFQEGSLADIYQYEQTYFGHTFAGWYTTPDFAEGTLVPESGLQLGTENVTVYAKWEPVQVGVTLHLDSQTASGGKASYGVEYTIPTPEAWARENTTIQWYTDKALTKPVAGPKAYYSTETLHFYGKRVPDTKEITLLYQPGAAAGVTMPKDSETVTVTYGALDKTVTLPVPAREGYVFAGWKIGDKTVTKSYSVSWNSESALIFTAQWSAEEYTISYELYGGDNHEGNPTSYNVETDEIRLQDPVRANSTFAGWYLDEELTQKVTVFPGGNVGNLTLYAKWIKDVQEIATQADLLKLFDETDRSWATAACKDYILTADITLDSDWTSSLGWNSERWMANFDGSGHTITYDGAEAPLFGVVGKDGTVKDLRIVFAQGMTASYSQLLGGQGYAWGGLVQQNCGRIENCAIYGQSASASLDEEVWDVITHKDSQSIGGLVGYNDKSGRIINCTVGLDPVNGEYRPLRIRTNGETGKQHIGGLLGRGDGIVTLSALEGDAYNVFVVISGGTTPETSNYGGLVGRGEGVEINAGGASVVSVIRGGTGFSGGLVGGSAFGTRINEAGSETTRVYTVIDSPAARVGGILGYGDGTVKGWNVQVILTTNVVELTNPKGDSYSYLRGATACRIGSGWAKLTGCTADESIYLISESADTNMPSLDPVKDTADTTTDTDQSDT